ncbi:MAG: AzlC family ABC transporter permease [Clostridia bacterium]|nr:AzlC family ABC transporter permease [Clostridia bacterium]
MTSMKLYRKGMKDGIPISLGYFAVAFTLGIAAKNAGLSSFQASLTSFLVNASAGEFAGFTLIAAGASYLELAIMMAVANARYLLMSCSLSQKFDEKVSIFHRLAVGFYLTDEIFGVSVATPGKLNPVYTYGVITTAAPGWTLGTYLGVVMGNVLPENIVSALSVGLFGMFLAIIIPPARKNKLLAGIIAVSMALSYIATKVSFLKTLSSGTVIIILTVLIAGAAAVLFPAKEEKDEE